MYSNILGLMEQEDISPDILNIRLRDIEENFQIFNSEDKFKGSEKFFDKENHVLSVENNFDHALKKVFQKREEKEEDEQSKKEEENFILKEVNKNQNSPSLKNAETKNSSDLSSEMEIIQNENKASVFDIIYPEKILLFDPSKTKSIEGFDLDGFVSRKRIRSKTPRKRLDYDDDTRKKIKRKFFNKDLIDALKKLLKNSNYYFAKFPQRFVGNVTKETNKKLVNLSLKEFFEDKEYYEGEKLDNYYHNLKVLNSLKNEKNWKINIILNTRISDLFNEYINSDEFKVDEINRLKKKNKSNVYIERYIYLSKHLMEFFSE